MKENHSKIFDAIKSKMKQHHFVAGVDESGAGCLAGNLVVCGCILPKEHGIKGLTDSKKINAKQRESLYEQITQTSIEYSRAPHP